VLSAVSLADGSVREIYSTPGAIGRPLWLPDSSGLLVSMKNADQTFRGQLWLITFPSGKVQRLTNDLMDYQLCCLGLTQDGKALVNTEHTKVSDLWIAPAGDTAKAKQITSREFAVGRFSWMPSGRIVFANGDSNLLALSPDGRGPTLLNEHASWDPSVCGDGRYIVYSSYQDQKVGIWRMDADGSNSLRIADESFAMDPQCSPDSEWVIYLRGPSWTPVRVSIAGMKNPEVLTQDCVIGFGHFLTISPDGKLIAYPTPPVENQASPSASRPNQLKVIPFDGGAPLHQFDWPASASTPRWALGGQAIQYISTQNGGLQYLATESGWRCAEADYEF